MYLEIFGYSSSPSFSFYASYKQHETLTSDFISFLFLTGGHNLLETGDTDSSELLHACETPC